MIARQPRLEPRLGSLALPLSPMQRRNGSCAAPAHGASLGCMTRASMGSRVAALSVVASCLDASSRASGKLVSVMGAGW